jgi:hypothetical protein
MFEYGSHIYLVNGFKCLKILSGMITCLPFHDTRQLFGYMIRVIIKNEYALYKCFLP